jgi:dTDP-4-dehydrorhamnose 3,5-epimerase
MIHGVKINKKKQIIDERGKIMHMLRVDDKEFVKFGEIYFSYTYPGAIKAWHRHKEMTLTYAAASGKIKLVLFDDRENSPSKGQLDEIFLSDEDYFTVTVPPMIWNGFKSIENKSAIVANCTDIPHSENEIERKEYNDPNIPYDWGMKLK